MAKQQATFKTTKIQNKGAMYHHARGGFKLLIPPHNALQFSATTPATSTLTIGHITLELHHRTQTLHGYVPESWLVDLNKSAENI